MVVETKRINVSLGAVYDMADITQDVKRAVLESGLHNGIVTVFVVGSTGAVGTMEFEPGLMKDIPEVLEKIAPRNADYRHHKTWNDDNGSSHVRSTLIGCGVTVPFVNGQLTLGTWQQIVVMNFDTSSRMREVIIQIMGERE